MGYFEFLKSKGIDDTYPRSWETKRKIEALITKLPKTISIETGVEIDVLKDGKLKDYPENDNSEGYWRHEDSLFMNHKTIQEAVEWLKNNIDPQKIKTVAQKRNFK